MQSLLLCTGWCYIVKRLLAFFSQSVSQCVYQCVCVCVYASALPSESICCPLPTRQCLRSAPRPITTLLQITLLWMLHLKNNTQIKTCLSRDSLKNLKKINIFYGIGFIVLKHFLFALQVTLEIRTWFTFRVLLWSLSTDTHTA